MSRAKISLRKTSYFHNEDMFATFLKRLGPAFIRACASELLENYLRLIGELSEDNMRGKKKVRSDYGLYGVAVICFVISAVFAGSAVPGYQLSDPNTSTMGVSVTVIFLLVGIIAAVLGYSVRPKATMPTATPIQPAPAATPIAPAPVPEPEPQLPPAPPLQKVEEIMVEPQASTSTAPAEPSELIETAPAKGATVETQETDMKASEEEEKPRDKPVRRRRKKAE